MLDYCAEHKIASDVEVIPRKINEAYERMLHGDVRYRFVIDAATFLDRGLSAPAIQTMEPQAAPNPRPTTSAQGHPSARGIGVQRRAREGAKADAPVLCNGQFGRR